MGHLRLLAIAVLANILIASAATEEQTTHHLPHRRVAVVIADGFYLIDAMGPLDVFRAAQLQAYLYVNLTSHEWRPGVPGGIVADGTLSVELIAPSTSPVKASDGVIVTPDKRVPGANETSPYDLVVIPASADTPEIRAFVKAHHARGGALMSVCTGARLLADLGLLDGLDATSNSLLLWDLRGKYPNVRWISLRDNTGRRFVVSQPPLRIVTTAGVTAGTDGALHILGEWLGRAVAEATREFIEDALPLEGS